MKPFYLALSLASFALLTGCGGFGGGGASAVTNNSLPSSPTGSETGSTPSAPGASDVMRVGDKITIRLTGVPGDEGYIIEQQIPPSGDITVQLLSQPFHAAGRSPADLAAEIAAAYRTQRIYTTPNVTIIPEERYVNVGGDVRTPMRVLYTSDLTMLGAINSCGGFTEYANKKAVRILRGQQVTTVDATAAAKTAGSDPALLPGDQVYVPRTIF